MPSHKIGVNSVNKRSNYALTRNKNYRSKLVHSEWKYRRVKSTNWSGRWALFQCQKRKKLCYSKKINNRQEQFLGEKIVQNDNGTDKPCTEDNTTTRKYLTSKDLETLFSYNLNRMNNQNFYKIRKILLKRNLLRGRHLFCKCIIKARHCGVYSIEISALVASVNQQLPVIGSLLLKYLVQDFRTNFESNSDSLKFTVLFISELTCYNVVHESLILQILLLLIESENEDCIYLVYLTLLRCGKVLLKSSQKPLSFMLQILKKIILMMRIALRSQGRLAEKAESSFTLILMHFDDEFRSCFTMPRRYSSLTENQNTHVVSIDAKVDETDSDQSPSNCIDDDRRYAKYMRKYLLELPTQQPTLEKVHQYRLRYRRKN